MRALDGSMGSSYVNANSIVNETKKMQLASHRQPVYHAPKKPTYHAPKRPIAHAPVVRAPVVHRPKVVSAINPPRPKVVSKPKPINLHTNDYNNRINDIFDNREKSQLAAFRASRDNAINGVNGQIADTRSDFRNQRNQADVVSTQNVQRLREIMASNGNLSSGENVTANVGLNAARQNALNVLNTQESQNVGQLQQRIADFNNPDKLNAMKSQIESDRAQALATAYQQSKDQAWREYTFNNMSASEKAQLSWAKKQYGEDAAWRLYSLNTTNAMQQSMNDAQLSAFGNFNSGGGGGDYQRDLSSAVKTAGIPSSQLPAFNFIISHESSFNPNAKNPGSTAHGYGQFLDSTVKTYEKKTGLDYSKPSDQLAMAYQYMVDRYGGAQQAMNFWKNHGWY